MCVRLVITFMLALLPLGAMANDGPVTLYTPPALSQSGLLRHILPRFSLKTGIRVDLVARADRADVVLGDRGEPLFQGAGGLWHLRVPGDHPGAARLAEWLRSDTGLRTITGFAPQGAALFALPAQETPAQPEAGPAGDTGLGLRIARRACARCHVVEKGSVTAGIGSSPSFMVLRGFDDWQARFAAFYALAPHPAFTQVTDVTDPFAPERPPPIAPIHLTLEDIAAISAYVAALVASDLGAPLQHQ